MICIYIRSTGRRGPVLTRQPHGDQKEIIPNRQPKISLRFVLNWQIIFTVFLFSEMATISECLSFPTNWYSQKYGTRSPLLPMSHGPDIPEIYFSEI